MKKQISLAELKAKIDHRDKFYLLEILPEADYHQGHIVGAINLPPDLIRELAPHLVPQKDCELIFYCQGDDPRAGQLAAQHLFKIGYTNVRELIGGKLAWLQAGLPISTQRLLVKA